MRVITRSLLACSFLVAAGCSSSDDPAPASTATDVTASDTGVDSGDISDVETAPDVGPEEDSTEPTTTWALAGGAVVDANDGLLVRTADGRVVWALADGAAPMGLTYLETNVSSFGQWEFTRDDEVVSELSGAPSISVDGEIVVARWDGEPGATLRIVGSDDRVRFELSWDQTVDGLRVPMKCDEDASFHGFGAQFNATDQRGEVIRLMVTEQGIGRHEGLFLFNGDDHTTGFPMPWWLDWRGFGVWVETDRRSYVDLCASDPDVAWFETRDGNSAAWSVFVGPTPLDVIRQLGTVVGRPAKPPAWAWGLWMGAQGGTDAVDAELAALKAANIPVSALWVQDWTGLRPNIGGGSGVQYRWEADLEWYPGFGELVKRVKDDGIRFLVYVNPFIDPKLPNHYDDMAAQGLLVKNAEGEPYTVDALSGAAGHPDFTNPATVAYTKDALRAIVETWDVDGWMADFSEYNPLDAVLHDGSDPEGYHNLYPGEWQRMTREVMDEVRPDGDWVMFARAGYTGVQAVAQIHWMHDQEVDFSVHDGLPTVIPGMVNTGLSGQPFVTHDIGGFSGGPREKEVFIRWTEVGAFSPVMRTHEGNSKDKNWQWDSDEETTAHFARFARIHEALRPELEQWAERAATTSEPIVKHLMLLYPEDANVRGLADQYIFGDKLLVAPVVTAETDQREVYLPAGQWFHVWTGTEYEGGQTITVDAPWGSPPVFSLGEDRPDLRAIN